MKEKGERRAEEESRVCIVKRDRKDRREEGKKSERIGEDE